MSGNPSVKNIIIYAQIFFQLNFSWAELFNLTTLKSKLVNMVAEKITDILTKPKYQKGKFL